MKWGVTGMATGMAWGVRMFDDKRDAEAFARGLQRIADRTLRKRWTKARSQKALKEWKEQDPGGVMALPVHLGHTVRYVAFPYSEEFEAPHEEVVILSPGESRIIADPNTETSLYMGAEVEAGEDGGYIAIGQNEEGWWVSLMIDSDTAHFVDNAFTDDGPYPTALAALESGVDGMMDWASDNDLYDAIERPMREDMIDHIEYNIGVDLPEYDV